MSIRLAVLLALLGSSAVAGASTLAMDIQPIFDGPAVEGRAYPVFVDMENTGPDATGVVRWTGDITVEIHVDLPRGARKRLMAYPEIGSSQIHFQLDTDKGTVDRDLPLPPPTAGRALIALIGGAPGELAFLRNANDTGQKELKPGYDVWYTKPENAPGRLCGYTAATTVILGAGCERMDDNVVDALKAWVLQGGTLVVPGGASALVLSDPRWSSILPVQPTRTETVPGSPLLESIGRAKLSGPLSVVDGVASADAVVQRSPGAAWCVSATRSLGLGRVVFLGFDPFERPVSEWDGRRRAFEALINPGDKTPQHYLSGEVEAPMTASGMVIVRSGRSYRWTRGGTTVTTTVPGGPSGPAPGSAYPPPSVGVGPAPGIESNPFNAKLPPSGQVFWLLAAFFVSVIPLNFLILKKLNRAELAWFTAPVLSLGFAGVMFKSAESLYDATMSTFTSGQLVAESGFPDAVFVGSSDLFFPRGGTFDLKLSGVDSVMGQPEQDPFGRRSVGQSVNAVDDGQIRLPRFDASNLSFRQIGYTQRLANPGWLKVSWGTGNDARRLTLTNPGPYLLSNAALHSGTKTIALGNFPAGKSVTQDLRGAGPTVGETGDQDGLRALLRNRNQVAVTGTIQGLRMGPQIGSEVGAGSINLTYLVPVPGGSTR